jgi:hypothetical protein
MAEILTVLSNGWFLLPAIQAAILGRWTRFMVYNLIIVASSMYHTCLFSSSNCVFDAMTHRKFDFFFAQLVIPLSALWIIEFPPLYRKLERILIILFALGIWLTLVLIGESFYIQLVLAAISLSLILVYWLIYAYVMHKKDQEWHFPEYNWRFLGIGLGYTAVASVLFATQLQNHKFYWAVHSCWHMIAAFGQYFLLLSKVNRPMYASLMSLDYVHTWKVGSNRRIKQFGEKIKQ